MPYTTDILNKTLQEFKDAKIKLSEIQAEIDSLQNQIKRLYERINIAHVSNQAKVSHLDAITEFSEYLKCYEIDIIPIRENFNTKEKALHNFFDTALKESAKTDKLDHTNLWKLLIDGKDHSFGRDAFDNDRVVDYIEVLDKPARISGEPNYIESMEIAFLTLLLSDQPFSVDQQIEIHDLACCNVRGMSSNKAGLRTGLGDVGNIWLFKDRATAKGIHELLTLHDNYCHVVLNGYEFTDMFYDKTDNYIDKNISLSQLEDLLHAEKLAVAHIQSNPHRIRMLYTRILEQLNQSLALAQNDDEKIKAIAQYGIQVDALHPFTDGNVRTALLHIQVALNRNGFDFTILENPNRLDGYDIDSMCDQIKIGMEKYRQDVLQIQNQLRP